MPGHNPSRAAWSASRDSGQRGILRLAGSQEVLQRSFLCDLLSVLLDILDASKSGCAHAAREHLG